MSWTQLAVLCVVILLASALAAPRSNDAFLCDVERVRTYIAVIERCMADQTNMMRDELVRQAHEREQGKLAKRDRENELWAKGENPDS